MRTPMRLVTGYVVLGAIVAAFPAGCGRPATIEENAAAIPFAEAVGPERLESAADEPLSVYADPQARFSIALPPGWNAAPDAPGIAFRDPATGAILSLGHAPSFDGAVAALRRSVETATASSSHPGDYRLVGRTAAGDIIRARVLATSSGGATARIRIAKDKISPLVEASADATLHSLAPGN